MRMLSVLAGVLAPVGLLAEDAPGSVIPWLIKPAPRAEASAPAPAGVTVETLTAPPADTPGIGDGLPADFWRGVSRLRAGALIDAVTGEGGWAARDLFRRILTARGVAPMGAGDGDRFLRRRAQALIRLAALPDAAALLALRPGAAPDLRRNIALLLGREDALCVETAADETPADWRIYCRAILGEADSARFELTLAAELGEVDALTARLLAALMDPDAARTAQGPARVDDLTPLRLAIVDRIGAPRPANYAEAPLAYAFADLIPGAPPRDMLEATERLVRAAALPDAALAEIYGRFTSAESGGAWGRVEAFAAFSAAPDDAARRAVLPLLHDRMDPALFRRIAPHLLSAHDQPDAADPDLIRAAGRPVAQPIGNGAATEIAVMLDALAAGAAPLPSEDARRRATRGEASSRY